MDDLNHRELNHKGWVPKNWCFWTVVLEKTLESPLDSKIKPVNPKRKQPLIFIGSTDAEAEAPVLWPSDPKSQLIGKGLSLILGKIEGRRRRGWQRMRWLDRITNLWTWVWANSRREGRTGKPGVLLSTGSQRVGHDLVTEQQLGGYLASQVLILDLRQKSIWPGPIYLSLRNFLGRKSQDNIFFC